jgi:hypothetical protein
MEPTLISFLLSHYEDYFIKLVKTGKKYEVFGCTEVKVFYLNRFVTQNKMRVESRDALVEETLKLLEKMNVSKIMSELAVNKKRAIEIKNLVYR